MRLVHIREEAEGFAHLPSPVSTNHTLCGWVDVDHDVVDGATVTCPSCCAVVREAQRVPPAALAPKRRSDKHAPKKRDDDA